MKTYFQVSREDRDGPEGWVPIGRFGSLHKAEANVAMRERAGGHLYSNRNPNRLYYLIEAI